MQYLWTYETDWPNDVLQPLEFIVAEALEWYEANPDAALLTIREMRRVGLEDVRDYTDDVIDFLRDRFVVDEDLSWSDGADSGHPVLYMVEMSPAKTALRQAIASYLAAHLDFEEAVWIGTGVQKAVTRAGGLVEVNDAQ